MSNSEALIDVLVEHLYCLNRKIFLAGCQTQIFYLLETDYFQNDYM